MINKEIQKLVANLEKEHKELLPKWLEIKDSHPYREYIEDLIDNYKLDKNFEYKIYSSLSDVVTFKKLAINGKLDLKYILHMCPSSNKLYYFNKYKEELDDKEYWEFLAFCYTMQDFNSENPYLIVEQLFLSKRQNREYLMNEEERRIYNNLPSEVTVFRGASSDEAESKKYRFSWTLSEEIAEKFAERNETLYEQDTEVIELTIPKKHILAYFNDRKEEEIIYLPNLE